jgi:tetratricopeptide (TPR) repeat protein
MGGLASPGLAHANCLLSSGAARIEDCSRLIGDPESPTAVLAIALRLRAGAYFDLQKYAEAKADLDALVATGQATAADWSRRGLVKTWLGDWPAALADQQQADRMLPGSPQIVFQLGFTQAGAGLYEEALKSFAFAEQMGQGLAYFHAYRGWAYYKTAQYDQALAEYEKALAAEPANTAYLFERGYIYEDLGKTRLAIGDYSAALLHRPREEAYLNARARVLRYEGEFARAVADLDAVISEEPTPSAYFDRASTWVSAGELEKAEADIAKAENAPELQSAVAILRARILAARGQTENALSALEQIVKAEPLSNDARYWQAVMLYRLGRYGEAYPIYSDLRAIWPRDISIMIERAETAIELNKNEDALADVNAALDIDPEYTRVLEARALLMIRKSRYASALQDCRKAVAIDAGRPLSHYRCGLAHWMLNETKEAEAAFSEAIRLDPEFALAWGDRGELRAELDRFDEAYRDNDEALKLSANDPAFLRQRSLIALYEGKLDDSLKHYDRAIAAAPEDAWGYEGRAWARIEQRRLADALDDCERAIAILPERPAGYRCRARVHWEGDHDDKALADLDKALELNVNYGPAHYDRGMMLLRRGEAAAALQSLSAAVLLNFRKPDALVLRADAKLTLNDPVSALRDYQEASRLVDGAYAMSIARRIANAEARIAGRAPRHIPLEYPQRRLGLFPSR